VYSIQHYVMKFVSDLRQVGGFLRVLRFPPPTARHEITEILLKMALNTIKLLNETKFKHYKALKRNQIKRSHGFILESHETVVFILY
jgi:hypothetical protein